MEQISDRVHAKTDWYSGNESSAGSNSGLIATACGVVLVDAPLVPANAVAWRKTALEFGPLKYLVNTEFHADHTLGDYFFDCPLVAHELTAASIGSALESAEAVRAKVARLYPSSAALVDEYRIRTADITFDTGLKLNSGGLEIRVFHTPGHTPGQSTVFIPEEGVVFTGDNFSNGFQPALSYGLPLQWLASLKRLLALPADRYVPGHGPVGGKAEVREFMRFLQTGVDEVAAALARGWSREEAAERIEFEDRLEPRHPGREQQRKNVLRIYDMLSETEKT